MERFHPVAGSSKKKGPRTGLSATHPILARERSILGQRLAKEFPGLQPHIRMQLYYYLRNATTEAEKRRLIDLAYAASHLGALESTLNQQSFLANRLRELNRIYMRFAVRPISGATFSVDLRQLDAEKERLQTALNRVGAKSQRLAKAPGKRPARK